MTQREKIELLKDTIVFLYEKEGRSKSYIARLLVVDRKVLIEKIKEWNLIQANISYLSPSNQKFLNRNRELIKSRLDNDYTQVEIAEELGITRDKLVKLIPKDKVLNEANQKRKQRIKQRQEEEIETLKNKSRFQYDFEDMEGEVWVEILGYEGYWISNKGRVKSYVPTYGAYKLLTLAPGGVDGRLYVRLGTKNLQVARLVGFAFVGGHSEESNTINHIDGDFTNNDSSNLEWVSQSVNNKKAYDMGRSKVIAYQKNGRFKKIILNDTYEFKTITALAKFLKVSPTQVQRYISNECSHDYKIEFIY